MRLFVLLLIATASVAGCSFIDGERSSDWYSARALANTVEVETVSPNQVTFRYGGTTPSPCHAFDRIESARSGMTVSVRVLVRTEAELCIGIPGTIEESISVSVPSSGTYTFLFERPQEFGPLEVVVAVP
jgi:hypothetical protein